MVAATGGSEQVLIGVIIGLVVVGLPLLIRYMARLGKKVDRAIFILAGSDDPLQPVKGLVEQVRDLAHVVGAGAQGVAELIKDSKPDNGSTMRDAVDRIEVQTQPLIES